VRHFFRLYGYFSQHPSFSPPSGGRRELLIPRSLDLTSFGSGSWEAQRALHFFSTAGLARGDPFPPSSPTGLSLLSECSTALGPIRPSLGPFFPVWGRPLSGSVAFPVTFHGPVLALPSLMCPLRGRTPGFTGKSVHVLTVFVFALPWGMPRALVSRFAFSHAVHPVDLLVAGAAPPPSTRPLTLFFFPLVESLKAYLLVFSMSPP